MVWFVRVRKLRNRFLGNSNKSIKFDIDDLSVDFGDDKGKVLKLKAKYLKFSKILGVSSI